MKKKASAPRVTDKNIGELEDKIRLAKQELAQLRRRRAPERVRDYTFTDTFGASVRLSQLFGDKNELLVIHNMGVKCSYCTLWADGFNGVLKHLENRLTVVLESPDDPRVQRKFAADRGWLFRIISSRGSSFRKDLGYTDGKNNPWPGLSVLVRSKDGKITRVSHTGLGPGDNFCVVWDILDLLPKGWSGNPGDDGADIDYFYSKVR
jgi:predicted dithiol-disulfide oxidoreductase (DUF899 family)